MKTIFISLFEGVEAKNILRTSVVSNLLKDPKIQIIFLMRSQERIDFYKREFNNPRLIYVIAPYSRNLGKGWDRFFGLLKFQLLRTRTTNLRRKMALERGKNYMGYVIGHLINFLLAHRLVRTLARRLDFALVRSNRYKELFDEYHPDVVFLAHLFEEPEIHILREARRRGIPTIGLVNSWDKVTARCIMRLLPDTAIVFNDVVKNEMAKYNDMKEGNIIVSGLPQYDHYFTDAPSSRETFFKRIGVDPNNKLIVYAPFGISFSSVDWEMADRLYALNREGKFGPNVSILVRFQPNDFLDQEEVSKRPELIYDYPGTRFSSKRGVDWDMDAKELSHLRDTLAHMSLLISWAGSIGVDAVTFNKPIINPHFMLREESRISRSPITHYHFAHYKKVLTLGGIRAVKDEDELVEWINRYLTNPSLDSEGRKRLIATEIQFTDGKSGERIAAHVRDVLTHT